MQVYRVVTLEQSNPGLVPSGKPGDIIAFYNECFIPSMKPFLLRRRSSSTGGGDAVAAAPSGALTSAPMPCGMPPSARSAAAAGAGDAATGTNIPSSGSLLGRPPIPRVRRISAEGMPPQQPPRAPVPFGTQPGANARPFCPPPGVPAAPPHLPQQRASADATTQHGGGLAHVRGPPAPQRLECTQSLPADGAREPPAGACTELPLSRMPSGISALLMALDSAEASDDCSGRSRAASPSVASGPAHAQQQQQQEIVQQPRRRLRRREGEAAQQDGEAEHASASSGSYCTVNA